LEKARSGEGQFQRDGFEKATITCAKGLVDKDGIESEFTPFSGRTLTWFAFFTTVFASLGGVARNGKRSGKKRSPPSPGPGEGFQSFDRGYVKVVSAGGESGV
jgi:hypothetical protein